MKHDSSTTYISGNPCLTGAVPLLGAGVERFEREREKECVYTVWKPSDSQ